MAPILSRRLNFLFIHFSGVFDERRKCKRKEPMSIPISHPAQEQLNVGIQTPPAWVHFSCQIMVERLPAPRKIGARNNVRMGRTG